MRSFIAKVRVRHAHSCPGNSNVSIEGRCCPGAKAPRVIVLSMCPVIDLVKHVSQLYGADRRGRPVHRAKVSRGSPLEAVRTQFNGGGGQRP